MGSSAAREDRQEQVGPDVEAAIAMHHVTDVVLGPGEDSSTGNVTGGRKFARYVLVVRRRTDVGSIDGDLGTSMS